MEYRLATKEDTQIIDNIVQDTIRQNYPKYYLSEIVDMFCEFHNKEAIEKDILEGKVYALMENDRIVGTGTIDGNHITRVYVLPSYQGRGMGTYIMNQLEQEIGRSYDKACLDASLPASGVYYHRGYVTVDHGNLECKNGVILVYEIMEKKVK